MGRPKGKPKTEDAPPEQQALEVTPSDPPATISKAEAVRRAVAAGREKPAEGVEYVMKHFGIEMDNKTFSLNRSQQRARERKAAEDGATTSTLKPAVEGYLAPPPKPHPVGTHPDLLAAMEAMKPLVASLGKEQVKRIVELLG